MPPKKTSKRSYPNQEDVFQPRRSNRLKADTCAVPIKKPCIVEEPKARMNTSRDTIEDEDFALATEFMNREVDNEEEELSSLSDISWANMEFDDMEPPASSNVHPELSTETAAQLQLPSSTPARQQADPPPLEEAIVPPKRGRGRPRKETQKEPTAKCYVGEARDGGQKIYFINEIQHFIGDRIAGVEGADRYFGVATFLFECLDMEKAQANVITMAVLTRFPVQFVYNNVRMTLNVTNAAAADGSTEAREESPEMRELRQKVNTLEQKIDTLINVVGTFDAKLSAATQPSLGANVQAEIDNNGVGTPSWLVTQEEIAHIRLTTSCENSFTKKYWRTLLGDYALLLPSSRIREAVLDEAYYVNCLTFNRQSGEDRRRARSYTMNQLTDLRSNARNRLRRHGSGGYGNSSQKKNLVGMWECYLDADKSRRATTHRITMNPSIQIPTGEDKMIFLSLKAPGDASYINLEYDYETGALTPVE